MKQFSFINRIFALLGIIISFLGIFGLFSPVLAEDNSLSATITSDKLDYSPWETATINGTNLTPIHTYSLTIFSNDPPATTHTAVVATNETGSFVYQYTLDGIYRPHYTAQLYDGTSLLSTIYFNDSPVGTYDQCSNDEGDGYATGDSGCRWVNGNLQASNSVYSEHEATPQRLWLTGFVPGSTHSVTFKYGTTKGGKHAYDYLTDYDHSESWINPTDRCDGIDGCITTSETSAVMATDPNALGYDTGSRHFVMRGGTLTSSSAPSIVGGSYASDSETAVTVGFTVANSGDMCETKGQATTCGVALWFGAHIAAEEDWGTGNGATAIPGSPYHVSLDAIDGSSAGERDNQMQSAAIVVPTQATLTLLKTVVNDNGGSAADTDWTLSAAGPTAISGVEGDAAITAALVDAGEYTLAESNGPSGYTPSLYSCVVNEAAPVVSNTLTLAPDDVAVCTITNDDQQSYITVVKVVNNSYGGTAAPDDFELILDGNPVSSGVAIPVDPGTYSAAETLLGGYSFDGFSSDCDAEGNITVGLGQSKTCTLTNSDIQPKLTLTKIVVNDNGGDAVVSDFPLFVDENGVVSGVKAGFIAGRYIVSEANLPGYEPSDWTGDCTADGSITLNIGDDKACSITNDDQQAYVTVVKVVMSDNGGDAQPDDFDLTLNGGTVLSGAATPVEPGTYSAAETQLDGYTFVGYSDDCDENGDTTVELGESKTCTLTNDDISPSFTIVKDATPNDLQDFGFGGTLGSFSLDDDANVIGADDILSNTITFDDIAAGVITITENEPNSFWALGSASCVDSEGASFASTLSGTSLTLTLPLASEVTCTLVNNKLGPTRTQGFWQTHTEYTGTVFGSSAMQKYIGVNLPVAPGSHKGQINNVQTAGQSELFGAYFSSISMKSTGKGKTAQRLPVDQARMILLQQLVTTKLNCAAFGCPGSILAEVSAADAAYVAGSQASILIHAGALGAYNNSGDTVVIDYVGKATPALSKSLATISFWDAP